MVVLATLLIVAVIVPAAVLRHRTRRRWVSPYATFRSAGARVTRTGEHAFDIAAVRLTQPS